MADSTQIWDMASVIVNWILLVAICIVIYYGIWKIIEIYFLKPLAEKAIEGEPNDKAKSDQ
jgi:hypothetical protein